MSLVFGFWILLALANLPALAPLPYIRSIRSAVPPVQNKCSILMANAAWKMCTCAFDMWSRRGE